MKNSKRKHGNNKKKRTSKRNKKGVFMVGGMTKDDLNKKIETITKTTIEEITDILKYDHNKEEKINKIKIIFKEEYITKFIGTILEFDSISSVDKFILKYKTSGKTIKISINEGIILEDIIKKCNSFLKLLQDILKELYTPYSIFIKDIFDDFIKKEYNIVDVFYYGDKNVITQDNYINDFKELIECENGSDFNLYSSEKYDGENNDNRIEIGRFLLHAFIKAAKVYCFPITKPIQESLDVVGVQKLPESRLRGTNTIQDTINILKNRLKDLEIKIKESNSETKKKEFQKNIDDISKNHIHFLRLLDLLENSTDIDNFINQYHIFIFSEYGNISEDDISSIQTNLRNNIIRDGILEYINKILTVNNKKNLIDIIKQAIINYSDSNDNIISSDFELINKIKKIYKNINKNEKEYIKNIFVTNSNLYDNKSSIFNNYIKEKNKIENRPKQQKQPIQPTDPTITMPFSTLETIKNMEELKKSLFDNIKNNITTPPEIVGTQISDTVFKPESKKTETIQDLMYIFYAYESHKDIIQIFNKEYITAAFLPNVAKILNIIFDSQQNLENSIQNIIDQYNKTQQYNPTLIIDAKTEAVQLVLLKLLFFNMVEYKEYIKNKGNISYNKNIYETLNQNYMDVYKQIYKKIGEDSDSNISEIYTTISDQIVRSHITKLIEVIDEIVEKLPDLKELGVQQIQPNKKATNDDISDFTDTKFGGKSNLK